MSDQSKDSAVIARAEGLRLLRERFGASTKAVESWIKAGSFPRYKRLSPRKAYWPRRRFMDALDALDREIAAAAGGAS
jgi:hypothetical protein